VNKEINKYLQEEFENILSAHWHKLAQIKELIQTSSGSPLRIKSINDRKKELNHILVRLDAFKLLFEDYLHIPKWYKEQLSKYS